MYAPVGIPVRVKHLNSTCRLKFSKYSMMAHSRFTRAVSNMAKLVLQEILKLIFITSKVGSRYFGLCTTWSCQALQEPFSQSTMWSQCYIREQRICLD